MPMATLTDLELDGRRARSRSLDSTANSPIQPSLARQLALACSPQQQPLPDHSPGAHPACPAPCSPSCSRPTAPEEDQRQGRPSEGSQPSTSTGGPVRGLGGGGAGGGGEAGAQHAPAPAEGMVPVAQSALVPLLKGLRPRPRAPVQLDADNPDESWMVGGGCRRGGAGKGGEGAGGVHGQVRPPPPQPHPSAAHHVQAANLLYDRFSKAKGDAVPLPLFMQHMLSNDLRKIHCAMVGRQRAPRAPNLLNHSHACGGTVWGWCLGDPSVPTLRCAAHVAVPPLAHRPCSPPAAHPHPHARLCPRSCCVP